MGYTLPLMITVCYIGGNKTPFGGTAFLFLKTFLG